MLLPVTITVLILALVTYHWTSLGLQFILMLLPVTMTVLILALVTYHWTSLGLQFILMLLPVTMTVLILALVSFLITGRVWGFSLFCRIIRPRNVMSNSTRSLKIQMDDSHYKAKSAFFLKMNICTHTCTFMYVHCKSSNRAKLQSELHKQTGCACETLRQQQSLSFLA